MKRLLLSFIALSLALGVAACKSEPNPEARTPEVIRNVAIVKAESVRLPDTFFALGSVRASQTSQLAAQIMGTVTAVNVHEGDVVKQGEVLVVIDAAQAQAGVDRAQAALSSAQHELTAANTDRTLMDSTLKRYTTLYERKSVSPQEFDEVKARQSAAAARAESALDVVTQSKAALAQAQTAFNFTRIRAPFDGTITSRAVDPGAMATPGTPLLTVEASGRYRAELTVDESSLQFARLGEDVPVSLDAYPDQHITGKVVQIVPSADTFSRTFLVKVELPHSDVLRSGLSAKASFSRGMRDSVVIPRNAVLDRGALKCVYVIGGDGLIALRYVTLGSAHEDRYEVLSGLAAGEKVVSAPGEREIAGKRVEVQ